MEREVGKPGVTGHVHFCRPEGEPGFTVSLHEKDLTSPGCLSISCRVAFAVRLRHDDR